MIRKSLTPKQRDDQRKKLIQIIRSPIYTKKQKRIAACKWRFNQLNDDYRETHAREYMAQWAGMQMQPESDFEHLTKY